MAISRVSTLLALDEWAEYMAIPGWFFSQVTHPNRPKRGNCDAVWLQGGYLSDPNRIVGRDDVARAIATAEELISRYWSFWPTPVWVKAEEHEWPLPRRGDQATLPYMHTNWGYVVAPGVEAWDLEGQGGEAILYSSSVAGESIDTATIGPFATAITDPCEIVVVPPGLNPRLREWRIRPLDVVIAAGMCTITGPRWLFVDPSVWNTIQSISLDSLAVGEFLTTVDVYRHYNDTSIQAQYRWTNNICDTPPCADTCQTACVTVYNKRIGQFTTQTATYSGGVWTNAVWSVVNRYPDNIDIWYYAGYRDNIYYDCTHMSRAMKEAITRLANVFLPEAPCGCGLTVSRWRSDREEQDMNSMNIALTQQAFGTTARGAVFAYSVVSRIPPLGRGG